jgi:hypothetical protein
MMKERDPRLDHRRFLARKVIVKFLRDHVEQRRQLGIGSRRGSIEQKIDRGVVTIHERNAKARSRRHY